MSVQVWLWSCLIRLQKVPAFSWVALHVVVWLLAEVGVRAAWRACLDPWSWKVLCTVWEWCNGAKG
jgi:hypothetical protein